MNVVLNAAVISLRADGAPSARSGLLPLRRSKRRSRPLPRKVLPSEARRNIANGKGTGSHAAPSATLTR